jgi:hypothetical protein
MVKPHDKPADVTRIDDEILVDGPDGMTSSMTVEAARETAQRLEDAIADQPAAGDAEPDDLKRYAEPATARAENGEVFVDCADGDTTVFTPEAALETARRVEHAAVEVIVDRGVASAGRADKDAG